MDSDIFKYICFNKFNFILVSQRILDWFKKKKEFLGKLVFLFKFIVRVICFFYILSFKEVYFDIFFVVGSLIISIFFNVFGYIFLFFMIRKIFVILIRFLVLFYENLK